MTFIAYVLMTGKEHRSVTFIFLKNALLNYVSSHLTTSKMETIKVIYAWYRQFELIIQDCLLFSLF